MKAARAYAPQRDPVSKVRRRLTQWRTARPVRFRFAEPMLSICFDDFPVSAAEAGARILEAHGARATFYASAGLAGIEGPCGINFSPADARRLAEAGHEIGCHTYAHADCAKRPVYDTLQDLAANRDALTAMGCPSPQTLAYPYGETPHALKTALPPRFAAARGIARGLNVGRGDLTHLRAVALFGEGGMAAAHAALQRTAHKKAWMIAFTHDVSDAPSPWGTSTHDLDEFLHAAHELGVVVAPVRAVLRRRLG